MIEPTDEMLAAFLAAWDDENRIINESGAEFVEVGQRDRAGLTAVLAIVERDYEIKRRVCGNRGFVGASGCWRELGHEGNHLWSRPDGTS